MIDYLLIIQLLCFRLIIINVIHRSDLNSLQTLDARVLLKHPGCISSTPASSLDLEWEHEGKELLFSV